MTILHYRITVRKGGAQWPTLRYFYGDNAGRDARAVMVKLSEDHHPTLHHYVKGQWIKDEERA